MKIKEQYINMMKLIWKCHYDGRPCEKEKVQVIDGIVIEPERNTIDSICERCRGWETCLTCPRVGILDADTCYGQLEFSK